MMYIKRVEGRIEVWREAEYALGAPVPPTPGERLIATFACDPDAEDCIDSHNVIMRQGRLLTQAVNLLRGPPPALTSWSHHDIVELVAGIMKQNIQLGLLAKHIYLLGDTARMILEGVADYDRKTEAVPNEGDPQSAAAEGDL